MPYFKILLSIQYISIILMIFLCACITKKWSKPAHAWLFFYCITTLVNNAGYLALLHAQTEREALLIWQFTYICRAWIPFALFKFGLFWCTGKRYPRLTNVLAYIHALMYIMVLTMRHNHLYYSGYQFVDDGLFPHFVLRRGPLHFIYDAMCLVYAVVIMRLMILSAIKEKDRCRRRQFIVIASAIFTVIIFWICKVCRLVPDYDMTALGFTVAAVIICIGIFCFDILDTKNMSEAVVMKEQPEVVKNRRIEAYGDYDMRVKLPVSEILYFEADAERVFAYTSDEIYNVKLRLYQVEEFAQGEGIIRVSKSHLINVRKIESVRPAINSRLYVKMLNGEEVLVSRKYTHALKKAME